MKICNERREKILPSDKFIVSYPRSGNTWMRFLFRDAAVYAVEGRDRNLHQNIVIPDIHVREQELGHADAVKYFGPERIIKSHNIDQLEGHRLIYLFRYPADVLVSHYFHHMRKEHTRHLAEDLGIDRFCMQMLEEWGEHIATVLRFENQDDVLMVPYERMHEQPESTLDAAMRFLGVPVRPESIRHAVEKNRFERLQREEKRRLENSADAPPQPMFRSGRIGDARNHLQPAVLQRIEELGNRLYDMAFEKSAARFADLQQGGATS